jgi:hypothetical protein
VSNTIKVWSYEEAPEEYKSKVQPGFEDSIEWIILVPPMYDQKVITWLEDCLIFENNDVGGTQLPSGEWLYFVERL